MSTILTQRRPRGYGPITLPEFSGGLNLRDATTELAMNESPDLWNVTVDERGGITKRLGFVKWNASAAANLITYGYYSLVSDKLQWYSQADGKLYYDNGTGVLTLGRTWTSGYPITVVDFAGTVYAVHPVDGLFKSTNGTSWSAVTATSGLAPKGYLLAVWQNKLWVAGDIAATTRLYFSAAGDATKWDAADGAGFNDVREGRDGDAPIVALFGATGSDFQTNPSLLVFKQRSTHRVTDSSTAAYITIDAGAGAAGQNAVTTAYGRIYTVSAHGIFETDGQSSLIPVGQKLEPQFTDAALNFAKESNFCAGQQRGRLYFSVTKIGSTINNQCFEYHPLFKAFTARSDISACYTTYSKASDTMIGASPSATGQLYQMNTGGSDDGADIQSWFLTRVFEPFGSVEARLQKVTVKIGGAVKMQVLPNFSVSSDQVDIAQETGSGFLWGSGVWGTDAWGAGDTPEGYAHDWPRVNGTAFQLRFDETSSLIRTAAGLLEGTYQPTLGAWALYGCDLAFNQLSQI